MRCLALPSRRCPPLLESAGPIALAVTALLLIAPVTAAAATGAQAPPATQAGAQIKAKAKSKAPAFHQDKTPLDPAVAGADSAHGSATVGVGSAGADAIRTIVGLAVVLGVIYGVYWLLKATSRSRAGRPDDRIGLVATTPLAPNRSLHLVRAGDELILVGATEHTITPLRVYTAEEALAVTAEESPMLALPPAEPAEARGLIETLRHRTARQ
jgi:flagellar protein FliO/FliZ